MKGWSPKVSIGGSTKDLLNCNSVELRTQCILCIDHSYGCQNRPEAPE